MMERGPMSRPHGTCQTNTFVIFMSLNSYTSCILHTTWYRTFYIPDASCTLYRVSCINACEHMCWYNMCFTHMHIHTIGTTCTCMWRPYMIMDFMVTTSHACYVSTGEESAIKMALKGFENSQRSLFLPVMNLLRAANRLSPSCARC